MLSQNSESLSSSFEYVKEQWLIHSFLTSRKYKKKDPRRVKKGHDSDEIEDWEPKRPFQKYGGNHSQQNSSWKGSKQNNEEEEEEEPEWMDSNDITKDSDFFMTDATSMPNGHSADDFEKWKAMMRSKESKQVNYEPEVDGATETERTNFERPKSTAVSSPDTSVDTIAPIAIPKPSESGVDNLFSWVGSQSQNSERPGQGSSKFSRFFGSGRSVSSEGGLPVNSQRQSSGGSIGVRREGENDNSIISPDNRSGESDKKGFQRIMTMLDGPSSGDASQVLPNSSSGGGSTLPEFSSGEANQMNSLTELGAGANNDAFFLSLLNKSSSSQPSSGQPPSVQLPDILEVTAQQSAGQSPNDSRSTPSLHTPVISGGDKSNINASTTASETNTNDKVSDTGSELSGQTPHQVPINTLPFGYFPGGGPQQLQPGAPLPPGFPPLPTGPDGQILPPPPGFFMGPGGPGFPPPGMAIPPPLPPGQFAGPPPPGFPYLSFPPHSEPNSNGMPGPQQLNGDDIQENQEHM